MLLSDRPFHATDLFLYTFRGYKKRPVAWNCLIVSIVMLLFCKFSYHFPIASVYNVTLFLYITNNFIPKNQRSQILRKYRFPKKALTENKST